MANYSQLKQSVKNLIKENGQQEITGDIMQSVLLTIIESLGTRAQFAGVATPATNPGSPDGNVFYVAVRQGTYSNFAAIEIEAGDGLTLLVYDGTWKKVPLGTAMQSDMETLTEDITDLKGHIRYEYSLQKMTALTDSSSSTDIQQALTPTYAPDGSTAVRKPVSGDFLVTGNNTSIVYESTTTRFSFIHGGNKVSITVSANNSSVSVKKTPVDTRVYDLDKINALDEDSTPEEIQSAIGGSTPSSGDLLQGSSDSTWVIESTTQRQNTSSFSYPLKGKLRTVTVTGSQGSQSVTVREEDLVPVRFSYEKINALTDDSTDSEIDEAVTPLDGAAARLPLAGDYLVDANGNPAGIIRAASSAPSFVYTVYPFDMTVVSVHGQRGEYTVTVAKLSITEDILQPLSNLGTPQDTSDKDTAFGRIKELQDNGRIKAYFLAKRYNADFTNNILTPSGWAVNTSYNSSYYIPVKKGDLVELTCETTVGYSVIGMKERNFVDTTTLVTQTGTLSKFKFTIPDNVNYIVFCGKNTSDLYIDVFTNVQGELDGIERYVVEEINIIPTAFYIRPSDGVLTALADTGFSGYIPVTPGEQYLYSGKATASTAGVVGYGENKEFLVKIICYDNTSNIKQEVCEDVLFTIPDGVYYIGCSTRTQSLYPLLVKRVYKFNEYANKGVGKMLSYNIMPYQSINTANGVAYSNGDAECTDFIKVKEGEILLISGKFAPQNGIAGYDEQKAFNLRLCDSSKDAYYVLSEAEKVAIRVPKDIAYIRAATIDRVNNPVRVYKKIEIIDILNDISFAQNQLKYVWFGDSISQLGGLVDSVALKIKSDIINCSFAGAPLTYSSSMYQGTGFLELSKCIASGDFTVAQNALNEQQQSGTDITRKQINLDKLEAVKWDEITTIVILAGTNDLSYSAATLENIENGLREAFQTIITKYPHLSIYFVSPPFRGTTYNPVNELDLTQIIESIKKVCNEFNVPFFDFFYNCGVNQYNKAYFLDSQELHPNQNGETLWSTKLSNWLKSL